jgi:TP901 family phage tail tape measure protein
MATIEELRANFTATFGSMTAGIRSVRKALQGIGQSSQESTQQANRAFKQFGSTLSKLQTEIKRTGSQGEFKDLNAAIAKAQTELKETGRVSEQSMKQLQQSVQASKTKLGTLSDEGKRNLKTFEPVLKDVDRQIKQLGGNSNLKKLTSDQRIAELQTKKLSEVVDIQSKRLGEENSRYKNLSSGVLGAGSHMDQLRSKQEHLTRVMQIQQETVLSLERKYNDSVSSIGRNTNETKELDRAISRVKGSMQQTERALQTANSRISAQSTLWGRMNTRLSEAKEHFQKLQDSGSAVAQTFGVATAVIGGGLGYTVKKAADFEQAMSNAESVMNPEDVKKYSSALEKLAITAGSKTVYSATEAAEAIGELQKAGVSTSDIMHGALYGSLNLATAGELDLKDAAEVASTALNAFRKDNISVSQAADILAGAANASATDVGELKYGLSMVSAVASGVGWTFKDTTTALATFAQAGLKGSDAGTSLKTMLMNLQPQTDKQAAEFKKLGIITKDGSNKFVDAHGHFKDLKDISEILRKSLSGLTDAQRQAALETMFGSDAIRAGNILYKAGAKGITDMANAMSKIKAADVAKQKLDNFKGTLEQLRGSLETASITLGESLTPALRALTVVVQHAVDGFNSLPEPMQHLIAIGAAVVAAVLGIVTAFGFIAMGIGGAMRGLQSFISLMARFRASAALSSKSARDLGISTSAAGAQMDAAGVGATRAGGKIKGLHGILDLAGAGLMAFGGKWGMVTGLISMFLPEILNAGKYILSFARFAITGGAGAGALAGGVGGASMALEAMGGPIGWVVLGLSSLTTGLIAAYHQFKPFRNWVNQSASSLKNGFGGAVRSVKGFFQPMIKTTISWGSSINKATKNALNGYVRLSDQAQKKLQQLVATQQRIGKKDIPGLVKPYKKMADDIVKHFQRMDKQSEKALSALRKTNKKEANQIEKDTTNSSKSKEKKVRSIESQIENIYKNAAKHHRSITNDEKNKINKLQGQMNKYASQSMSKSAKQQQTILGKLRDHASKLSAQQAAAIVRSSKKQRDQTISAAKTQYNKTVAHAKSQYNGTKKWADNQRYVEHTISKKQYDDVVNAAKKQKNDTINAAKKQKEKTIDHAREMHSKVVDQAKKQAHGHKDQVDWETGKVLSGWDKFVGSFAHVLNGISGFFNGVFSKIGLKSVHIPKWKPAGYARGTKGTRKDEVALTGEEGFELAHTPGKGIYPVGKEGPELRMLPKGTSILPHHKSVDLLNTLGIKGYASGIGDFFSGLWSKVQNGVSSAVDLLSSPKKLISWISDKVGLSGFQKAWNNWPAIHGLAVQLPKDFFKGIGDKLKDFGGGPEPSGPGVQRWKPYVIRALAMTGLPTTAQYINAWLRQIATESGGNPRAMQHDYTDINSIKGDLAKGLLQTISSTFNAFKMPGFGNIWNGFHDMLAAMRYAISRYGKKGMLAVIGHGHGYKTGGWNLAHTLAELSEDNKAEVVLPVESNKNRTLDLISQVLGIYGGRSVSAPQGQEVSKLLFALEKQTAINSQQRDLIGQLINVVVNKKFDDRDLALRVNKANGPLWSMSNYQSTGGNA